MLNAWLPQSFQSRCIQIFEINLLHGNGFDHVVNAEIWVSLSTLLLNISYHKLCCCHLWSLQYFSARYECCYFRSCKSVKLYHFRYLAHANSYSVAIYYWYINISSCNPILWMPGCIEPNDKVIRFGLSQHSCYIHINVSVVFV